MPKPRERFRPDHGRHNGRRGDDAAVHSRHNRNDRRAVRFRGHTMGHGYVKQRVSGVHQRQPATQRYLGESRRRLLVSAWWPREHDIRMTTGREQRAQKIGRAENRRDPGLYCGVFLGNGRGCYRDPNTRKYRRPAGFGY